MPAYSRLYASAAFIPTLSSYYFCCHEKVELIDVGLDEVASETLLHVLAGKATALSKLDLSRNSIGVRGATAVACLIASKGVLYAFVSIGLRL